MAMVSIDRPPIGSTADGLSAVDDQGGLRHLGERCPGRLMVLAFLKADCPLSDLYAPELGRLSAEYGRRGVTFIGLVPDSPGGSAPTGALPFPVLRDRGCRVAGRVGATRTPEVVVLDGRRVIRYRGRIDDRYKVGQRKAEAGSRELVEALESLLVGRPVLHPEVDAVGCRIDGPGRTAASTGPGVTYGRDVAPILQRRCVPCHRPGQVGPFSLLTYAQAAGRIGAIAEAVEDGRMPPWHADPRFGAFSNDPSLTEVEKRTIADWAASGAAEGDRTGLPPPAPGPAGWRIPEPDIVVSMQEAHRVPAEGVVDYQFFEVDPGFRQPTWVRAAEIRPGNRRVVHHCNVFLKAPGGGKAVDLAGELGSYCLAAMTPGSPPMVLADGMAKLIPAGWHLVFVVHYSPIGTAEVDRTSIGLVLADPSKVVKEVATHLLFDPGLTIPAGAPDHPVERSTRFEEDVLLLAMFPHMHLRGKAFRYEAVFPDGRIETLLDVPRYDFRWQHRYELAEPRRLPAGTTLRCIARYDNSAENLANPDPTSIVRAGPQSWDEMFNGYYDVALADQDRTRPGESYRLALAGIRRSPATPRIAALACLASAGLLARRRVRDLRGGRSRRPGAGEAISDG